MSNIIVVANVTIKEEFLDEVLEAVKVLHANTHKNDKGCIKYDFHEDIENKNKYTFVEIWESIEALEEHANKEHFMEFVTKTNGKILDMNVQKLKEIKF